MQQKNNTNNNNQPNICVHVIHADEQHLVDGHVEAITRAHRDCEVMGDANLIYRLETGQKTIGEHENEATHSENPMKSIFHASTNPMRLHNHMKSME